jgi:signal transduction histidine kinase
VTELDLHLVSVLSELHEDVMQRLFATGLGLQALIGQVPDEELRDRLRRYVGDLDDTLDEIRMTLLSLRTELARTV